ncbi:hypothetical protein GCM10022236_23830 [Microlunatus ginsengisoli]|uniref:DUF4352 domain-containing protein n=2 Tax=Microlunatus ginsengisoli TaxID=363863 RepID=A0ABP6ZZM3_9ACTN
MRLSRVLIALICVPAFAVAACSTPATNIEAGDGPANEQSPGSNGEPAAGPTEGEPGAGESTEPASKTADFHQKYTYEDGVEVEVINIKHGKVSRADAEYSEPEAKAGDAYATFTVRVRNGSKANLDAYASWTMTYGPDGTQAEQPYIASQRVEDKDMSGKILPGKSKTASETFAIPVKYQTNPVLEFSFDYEHEPAIFTGSIR